MTREEAIDVLKTETCYECTYGCMSTADCENEKCPFRKAVLMAIKALEQEPCADAISRVDVLEQINCWIESGEYRHTNATWYLGNRINDLPSVQPKTDALDKIRAELLTMECMEDAIEVIEKYR